MNTFLFMISLLFCGGLKKLYYTEGKPELFSEKMPA